MQHVEFWSLRRIQEVTGVSKSELYRKIRAGSFPQSHAYKDNPSRRFWFSNDVKAWQQSQIDVPLPADQPDDFDCLL